LCSRLEDIWVFLSWLKCAIWLTVLDIHCISAYSSCSFAMFGSWVLLEWGLALEFSEVLDNSFGLFVSNNK
jgi:hypothetical protein